MHRPLLLLALFAVMAFGAMGCTIATHPAQVAVSPAATTTHVVHHTAPTRVYHNGVWLHYRTDGYYYRSGSAWHVARTVPSHVHVHHRPGRPAHVTSHGYARPTYVHRGPTHVSRTVRSTARPTQVRGTVRSRPAATPTHVHRTTSSRRTYRR